VPRGFPFCPQCGADKIKCLCIVIARQGFTLWCMKIMTFNIWEGGIDEPGSRIDSIVDVIKEANPDFLALQEANNFDKDSNALLKKISSDIALPYYALSQGALQKSGKRYHVVVLSRYPLREEHRFSDFLFHCAALSVVIDSPLGEISICNLHLHAFSENIRLNELKVILKYQSQYKNHMLLGDFNSLSHKDEYDTKTLEVENRFDVTDILNKSYTDVASHLALGNRSTHPTPSNIDPTITKPIRIDYIFLTPSLTAHIKNPTVIKTTISEKASDHYPITLTLE